jgi:hypothetical protein
MIYKLYKTVGSNVANAAMTIGSDPQISFLFVPQNSDYETFKTNVLAGAELQDADGNVMTDASAYIASLP